MPKVKAENLCIDKLRKILSYDPEIGIFRWAAREDRDKAWNSRCSGKEAGCIRNTDGYRVIKIDGVQYLAHRLAFLYMTGSWPKDQVDHINGDRNDNRWCNLRGCTLVQNLWNSKGRKLNKSGYRGVYWHSQAKRWYAAIKTKTTTESLGLYDTKEEAYNAYRKAAVERYGQYAPV